MNRKVYSRLGYSKRRRHIGQTVKHISRNRRMVSKKRHE